MRIASNWILIFPEFLISDRSQPVADLFVKVSLDTDKYEVVNLLIYCTIKPRANQHFKMEIELINHILHGKYITVSSPARGFYHLTLINENTVQYL